VDFADSTEDDDETSDGYSVMFRRRQLWFIAGTAGLFLAQVGCADLHPPDLPSRAIQRFNTTVEGAVRDKPPERLSAFAMEPSEAIHLDAADPKGEFTGQPNEMAAAGSPRTLSLTGALQLAMAASPDLRTALARLQVADAVLARARAEFFPQLRISEDYGLSNNPETAFGFRLSQGSFDITEDPLHPGNVDDFHTQLRALQTLYAGGRRLAQSRSAAAQQEAEASGLAAVHNELIFRVAEAYYRLLQARQLGEVRRETVDQVQRELAVVRARIKAGAAGKLDELTVKVRLAEVEEALIAATNQQELAWAVLENVIGARVPEHDLPQEVPVAPWSERAETVEAAVREAMEQRPEVSQLASRERAALEDIRAVKSAKYPTVDFQSDYDVHTGDFVHGTSTYFVGLGVRLMLIDGGRTASEVRQAEARLAELRARRSRQALDIELEVRRAYLSLVDAKQRFRVASEAVTMAEETLREAEARYRGQNVIITQLIDAQVSLSNARVRYANVAADVEVARAALERATGRFANFVAQ
jgi:outer membrane protein